MSEHHSPRVALVDFGLGNLHSVLRACEGAGLSAAITDKKADVLAADAVLLPGVGAFGDAMKNLKAADLVGPLRALHAAGRPIIGICLGLQLLMQESEEFGHHAGLGLIEGTVVRFRSPRDAAHRELKVPHVSWSRVQRPRPSVAKTADPWSGTPLDGLRDGTHMYFVHSYYVCPTDPRVRLSMTQYGDVEFCSSVRSGNTIAFQFHPEKSGAEGQRIYRQIASFIEQCRLHKDVKNAC
ncbi:imidazole glycerol phosphate synthase subunit HisH [Planctomyces sp. SH-PL14]|uniref:imidazole glycerol phosphate synthase subunit HisH n=1 Tax=Planctomyces sp. SH-PL14 TaxID=1632864 RepID=UPI00078C3515|nr:imidazole glycerol phosphate synthase subunit HisH [Planctomyces sp. SH-PL14]AMV21409.1 Imidazole glycerol phosphate synthase subunit HisH 1 [Planctomyces sp. SH-PL14]